MFKNLVLVTELGTYEGTGYYSHNKKQTLFAIFVKILMP